MTATLVNTAIISSSSYSASPTIPRIPSQFRPGRDGSDISREMPARAGRRDVPADIPTRLVVTALGGVEYLPR